MDNVVTSDDSALPPRPKNWLPEIKTHGYPPRFAALKARILPDGQHVVDAWAQVITELATTTERFNATLQENIPAIDFSEIETLGAEQRGAIKRSGCVVIRNVVDDERVLEWKRLLEEYVKLNPQVEGFPLHNKQFFEIFWSRSQLEARSHPNVLATETFLNEFFHLPKSPALGKVPLVDLSSPLVYADRFRIRKPGPDAWTVHPPHIDGGSIEKWEDDGFREGCYKSILDGKWREHDAYDIRGRLNANTDMYGRENQSSVFRTWQGWMSMSDTCPGEGTLRLFPDVLLSNAYLLLRPFFNPITSLSGFQQTFGPEKEEEAIRAYLATSNWRFDNSQPDFPGVIPINGGKQFTGQTLDTNTHPHMRLDRENTMVSIPRVKPGDMVFWHCDAIHAVDTYHNGPGDSSVMYIPAVPLTPRNLKYITRQRAHFLAGIPAPDFPQNNTHGGEANFINKGLLEHLGTDPVSLRSMGLGDVPFPLDTDGAGTRGVRDMRELANQMLYADVSI